MTSLWNNNKDTSGSSKRNTLVGAEAMASTSTSTSTIINNQTIATNTSNLHIIKNRVELDSSLQGHLKALFKLTRGIERANHHTELLQASIDSSRPPEVSYPRSHLEYLTLQQHSPLNGKTLYREQVWSSQKNSGITGRTDPADLNRNTPPFYKI